MGRPRKQGARFPSGKLKAPTLAQMTAAQKSVADAEKLVALAQPHRRGNTSDLCGSALGRFCLAQALRRECYDAGLEYGMLKSKWRAAWGAPSDVRMGGSGRDIDMEVVRGWGTRITEMEAAMTRAGGVAGLGWVEEIAVNDRGIVLPYAIRLTHAALLALAVECGRLPASVLIEGELR